METLCELNDVIHILGHHLAAGESDSAAGFLPVHLVLFQCLYKLRYAVCPAGYGAGLVVALVYAFAAADALIAVSDGYAAVIYGYGVLWAKLCAPSAAGAAVRVAHGLCGEILRFRVMAPAAGHVAALKEHCGAYAVPIVYGVALYVGYQWLFHLNYPPKNGSIANVA